MSAKKPQNRAVIIALWLAGSAGRKQLAGFLRYVNSGRPWSFQLITDPTDFTDEVLQKAKIEAETGNVTADVLQTKDVNGTVFYEWYNYQMAMHYGKDLGKKNAVVINLEHWLKGFPDELKVPEEEYSTWEKEYYAKEFGKD